MSVRKNSPPARQKPISPQSLCTATEASPLLQPPASGAPLTGICTLPSLNPPVRLPAQSQSNQLPPSPLAPQRSFPLQPWASPPQPVAAADVPPGALKPPLLPVSEKGGQVYKVPSFIKKLYTIVSSPANADCITWSLNLHVPSIVVCLSISVITFFVQFSYGLPPCGNLICPFSRFAVCFLCVFLNHLLELV